MANEDIEARRRRDLERYHRQTAERRAKGLCPRCGKMSPVPDRTLCVSCAEKQRLRDYARYARLKAEGKKQPRNLEKARARGRRRYHRLTADRRAKGLCSRCGKMPPAPNRYQCGPCAEKQRQHERARYARLRARDRCTDCGAPSQAAAHCPPCARRSYFRSGEHRGLPLYPPCYTVIDIATGEDHGTFDSWEEVAMCLAFARLSLDQVEVLTDQSPMATCTSW